MVPYAGADIQGVLVSSVYGSDPFIPTGGLSFTYEIISDFSSTHPVESFTVGNFGNFLTDVSWDFGGGVAPVYASRSITGDVISYDFSLFSNPGIWPGQGSEILVVRTDAQFYQPTIASVINAGSAEVNSFAPIAVPEPASAGLIALVSGCAVFIRRRFMI